MGDLCICLTFDVERDWQGWGLGKPSVRPIWCTNRPMFSMIQRAIPQVQKILKEYGIKATFFLTGEVAHHVNESIHLLLNDGHEIGVHTHPYVHTRYFARSINGRKSTKIDSLSEYKIDEKLAMIAADLDAIEKYIGARPKSFRAGNLAIDGLLLENLRKLGIYYDSSIPIYSLHGFPLYFYTSYLLLEAKRKGVTEIPVLPCKDILMIERLRDLHLESWRRRTPLYKATAILLHPSTLGNPNLDINEFYAKLERTIKYCKQMKISFRKIIDD